MKGINPIFQRLLLGLGMLLLLIAIPHPVLGALSDPTVTVSDYQVTPAVLLPNDQGTITITIANTAQSSSETASTVDTSSTGTTTTSTTKDIPVMIESVFMYGKGVEVIQGNFAQVGALGPGQSTTLTFLIQAPAKSGMYFPEVWIRIPEGSSVKYPIPVNVNSPIAIQKRAILVLESALPDVVNPGEEIPVMLTVRNDGQLMADDVTVRINTSAMVAAKNSDNYLLGRIGSGDEKTVAAVLLSDKNTDPGLIQIPVTLQYNGVDGVPYFQTGAINVMMKGKSELGFVSVDTNPQRLVENTPFDLTIRIENTGSGEAKALSASIDLPSEGTKEAFIGKIKPGNDAPAVFFLEGLKSGTYPYTMTITYTDDLGVHVVTRDLSARVPPADSSGTIILGLIGLGLLGFGVYRFWYVPKKNGNGSFPWVKKN
ncbi:MAG: S-layer protein [Methanomicrobiales archaeon]|nr:S-layer protein [Methanomicrobiales archaeon]